MWELAFLSLVTCPPRSAIPRLLTASRTRRGEVLGRFERDSNLLRSIRGVVTSLR